MKIYTLLTVVTPETRTNTEALYIEPEQNSAFQNLDLIYL